MMIKTLFEEFNTVSAKEWKQKIQFDIKGADYNDTLVWNSHEGIAVKPFYHSDDFENIPKYPISPTSNWKICETIRVADEEQANHQARNAIKGGADSLWLVLNSPNVLLEKVINGIDLSNIEIHIECHFLSSQFLEVIFKILPHQNVRIHTDIIGNLVKTGNWHQNLNQDFNDFSKTLSLSSILNVDSRIYQNAGANMVQQLAYGLAHANEFLNHCLNSNSCQNINDVYFQVSVGTNYFFEIAKLRALRLLWKILAKEYNITADCHIIAFSTKRNKTLYDYNTNMLRSTTECMSAILGGANTICNLPYDAIYHNSNDFGDRIARNQLLILRHESYFDKVDNPADGAYYIEMLTAQLADKALNLFKDIEANGGFLKQLKDGTIQRKIKDSALKEQQLFDCCEEILLGSNKFPNQKDKMKDNIEISPFTEKKSRKTLIEPIIAKRLSETLEYQRLKSEI